MAITWTAPGATRPITPFDIAARQAITERQRRAAVKALYGTWDGKHCAFLYTAETLYAFPPVPKFKD